MRKVTWLALVIFFMVAASGCGGSGGSVRGSREMCRSAGASGSCEGHFNKLTGTYAKDFDSGSGLVPVEITVSVETGTALVSFELSDGSVVSGEATPGNPVTLSGEVAPVFNEIRVVFEAVTEQAKGIDYTLNYGP
jgi:hypothetical protein